MKTFVTLFGFVTLFSYSALAEIEVKAVHEVKLNAYLGTWNELYRIPNSFQYDLEQSEYGPCKDSQAKYSQVDTMQIEVENTCQRYSQTGQLKGESVRGLATIVDGSEGAKLIVNFTGIGVLRWLGIGDGDYWVLALGPLNAQGQYSWALVGEPTRNYGWILAREAVLPEPVVRTIFGAAVQNGYEESSFIASRRPAK